MTNLQYNAARQQYKMRSVPSNYSIMLTGVPISQDVKESTIQNYIESFFPGSVQQVTRHFRISETLREKLKQREAALVELQRAKELYQFTGKTPKIRPHFWSLHRQDAIDYWQNRIRTLEDEIYRYHFTTVRSC